VAGRGVSKPLRLGAAGSTDHITCLTHSMESRPGAGPQGSRHPVFANMTNRMQQSCGQHDCEHHPDVDIVFVDGGTCMFQLPECSRSCHLQ
jgi:hypothetical protein